MKKLYLSVFAFLGVLFLSSYSNAQCVQCAPSQLVPNTLSCQASSSGGNECSPSSNGQSCLIAGVCSRGGIGGEEGGSRSAQSNNGGCFKEKIGKVEFDKNIIREVGARHPRLGIALAWVNQSGFLGTKDVKIYLAPIEINNDVYNKWLNDILAESQTSALSASDQNATVRERFPSPPKGAETVIYAVDVVTQENSNNKTIRFSPVKSSTSDLTFTSLELFLEETTGDSPASAEKKWKVINWELN